jgi:hypothetical protein
LYHATTRPTAVPIAFALCATGAAVVKSEDVPADALPQVHTEPAPVPENAARSGKKSRF